MGDLIDMAGLKVGRLTVIGRAPDRVYSSQRRFAHWDCKCDCGRSVSVRGSHLRSGAVQSCGCLASELTSTRMKKQKYGAKPRGQAALNGVLATYRSNALARGIEWSLNDQEASQLLVAPCAYCGISASSSRKTAGGVFEYTGIDRFDNAKGYTGINSVPCCRMCNVAKNNHSFEKFKEWVLRVAETLKSSESV